MRVIITRGTILTTTTRIRDRSLSKPLSMSSRREKDLENLNKNR